MVDFLSRLIDVRNNELVEDAFLDEKLFAIFVHTSWFADIANYIVIEKIPLHYSLR